MTLNICKTICSECPFTSSSPKGWLGPHSLEDVLDTQIRGGLFSCHLLRKEDMSKQDIESGAVRICRGYIASATKSGIDFFDVSESGAALKELQSAVVKEAKENQDDILSRNEFIKHHGRRLPSDDIDPRELYKRMGYKA